MYQTEAFENPDKVAGEIELPPVEAVKGRARKSVVIVVPAISETDQRQYKQIMTAIVGLEGALAKGVTEGIDTPYNVVNEEDTHEAAPKETCPSTDQEGYYKG
jgi:hypothetical protein